MDNWIEKDIGAFSAYAIAVEHGYVGTEAEFAAGLVNAANGGGSSGGGGSDAVSVRSFGAVGDGVTDDSDALAAAAAFGRAVYFPAGVYILKRQIDMSADINWYGDGEQSVIRLMPADQTRPEEYAGKTVYNCYMINLQQGSGPRYGISLRDLVLDANKDAYEADVYGNGSTIYDHTTCLDLYKPTGVYLHNVICRNALIEGGYVYNGDSAPVIISDCRFENNGYDDDDASGLHIEGSSNYQTVVSNCIFSGNGFHGLLIGGAHGLCVSNISCHGNRHDGLCLWGGASYNMISNVHTEGNRGGVNLKGSYSAHIHDTEDTEYARKNTISGLVTKGNRFGIMFGNSQDTVISGWASVDDEYSYYLSYSSTYAGDVTGTIIEPTLLPEISEYTADEEVTDSSNFKVTVLRGGEDLLSASGPQVTRVTVTPPLEVGRLSTSDGGERDDQPTYFRMVDFLPVTPGVEYRLDTSNDSCSFCVMFYDADQARYNIAWNETKKYKYIEHGAVTAPEGAAYLRAFTEDGAVDPGVYLTVSWLETVEGGGESQPDGPGAASAAAETVRDTKILLAEDWRFYKVSDTANTAYTSVAEAATSFADGGWETVSIPHDWSIRNSFSSASPAGYEGGYLNGGDAWYRRKLPIRPDMAGRRVLLQFDGVYKNADVFVNGTKVCENRFGYNPFSVDITERISFTGENVLAVFVRNRQPSSRWYSGSGIYRPVTLTVCGNAEAVITDAYVTTPELAAEIAGGLVSTQLTVTCENRRNTEASALLQVDILDGGAVIATGSKPVTLPAGSSAHDIVIPVPNPQLWGVYNGKTYHAAARLTAGGKCYQAEPVKYGYRYTAWDANTGFWLNGKRTFLKGVCVHHDLGLLGAEVNRSAIERQVDTLIGMGCNAIRTAHNPASSEMLDVCTDKGVLLVEEFFDTWTTAKCTYDFAGDFTAHKDEVIDSVMRRDRSCPAIIMWSIGNEIIRTSPSYTASSAVAIAQGIIDRVRLWDETRPITMGEDSPDSGVARAVMALMDVIGINYGSDGEYSSLRSQFPGKPIYGSETTSALSTRGVYAHSESALACSSLDDDFVAWGDCAADALRRHMTTYPYLGGMFVWTGFDYIGEPTPFNRWTAKSSYFGVVDLAGIPKDVYYLYQSLWTEKPMVHLFPRTWSGSAGSTVTVRAYSNCSRIVVSLNGSTLLAKTAAERNGKYQHVLSVPYADGTLTVSGYDSNGALVAQDELRTAGAAASLRLTPLREAVCVRTDELAFVVCEPLDGAGNVIPASGSGDTVTFACAGGTIVGTDGGNSASVEAMRTAAKHLFSGKLLAMVRHDGTAGSMTVTATTAGGLAGSVVIAKNATAAQTQGADRDYVDKRLAELLKLIGSGQLPSGPSGPSGPVDPEVDLTVCTGLGMAPASLSLNTGANNQGTLFATAYPLGCTVPVVWSSSNAAVATVSGGVVTVVGAGSCTITATCGTATATATVTVEAVVTPVYALSAEREFYSANQDYIDTGIKLQDTDKDWALLIDFTNSSRNTNVSNSHCLLHCMHESQPWPGLAVAIWSSLYGLNYYDASLELGGNTAGFWVNYQETKRTRIFLQHEAGTGILKYYMRQNNNPSSKGVITLTAATPLATVAETLHIGCYLDASGNRGRYWNGTLHDLKVWNAKFTDAKITELTNGS